MISLSECETAVTPVIYEFDISRFSDSANKFQIF